MALRIIFMGTAELACASLAALTQSPAFTVLSVVTQPDRPKGRDLKLQPSPVKESAGRLGLPVLQPERVRNENFVQELRALQPDLIVVAAYGQILPSAILELPRLGCLNVHTSLLPKYRGASPIQSALLNDESETGVTIMKMDAGLDTGEILTQQPVPITPSDDAQTLHDRLAKIGAELLVSTIPDYAVGKTRTRPQPAEGVSYAPKITKQDGRLNWTQPARSLWNRIRAFTPWPGAFTYLSAQPKPQLLKIWEAEVMEQSGQPGEILRADKTGIVVACGRGALRILKLQLEGGRRLTAQEFLAGHPLTPERRFLTTNSQSMNETPNYIRRDSAEVVPWAETCGQIRPLIEEKDSVAAEVHHLEITDAKLHYHERTDEIYYVLGGQGWMQLDGSKIELREGVVVYVPRGVKHKAWGHLKVLVVCIPRGVLHDVHEIE